MEQFKTGDVVELKSGGPKMTIHDLKGSMATCVWFVGKDKKQDVFDVDMLKKPMRSSSTRRGPKR